jgi:glucokinase
VIVLAGDIGGTQSRLAFFEDDRVLLERVYASPRYESLEALAQEFLAEVATLPMAPAPRVTPTGGVPIPLIERACFGIAGPVEDDASRATNLPWVVDARRLEQRLGIRRVRLVNDFHAAALGVTLLGPEHLASLGGGPPVPHGPIVVLGAGTGLGEAFLLWSPTADRYLVAASEGGHADFAPRTHLEAGLLADLNAKYGRASWERVLSGPGLADMFTYLAAEPACRILVRPDTLAALAAGDPAAVVTQRGLDGTDPVCRIAITLFSSLLGSLAGSLALTFLATGGVFVAGGIAPRLVGFLQQHAFRDAFEAKGRLSPIIRRVPVFVVTHPTLGLLCAAREASRLA